MPRGWYVYIHVAVILTNATQDGFCPLGPCIVSAEEMPDPSAFQLRTSLNGKTMQKASADDMIFSIAEVVSYLSQVSDSLILGSLLTINRDIRCFQAR